MYACEIKYGTEALGWWHKDAAEPGGAGVMLFRRSVKRVRLRLDGGP